VAQSHRDFKIVAKAHHNLMRGLILHRLKVPMQEIEMHGRFNFITKPGSSTSVDRLCKQVDKGWLQKGMVRQCQGWRDIVESPVKIHEPAWMAIMMEVEGIRKGCMCKVGSRKQHKICQIAESQHNPPKMKREYSQLCEEWCQWGGGINPKIPKEAAKKLVLDIT
jgi:hypothetical protein